MKKWNAVLTVLGIVWGSVMSFASIPHLINYQGQLYDNEGTPLSGSYDFQFTIYDGEMDGNPVWTEIQPGVSVLDGIFNVKLGTLTPIDMVFSGEYWLEIVVGGEVLSPRSHLTSVGQAYNAEDTYASDIHPRSVSIEGVGEVINALGEWVGDPTGLEGPQGPTGPMGSQGIQGEVGPMGPTGPQGIQGEAGPMGSTGPQGIQGEAGPMGPTGPQGIQGEAGPMGPTGPQGIQGEAGPMGPTGPQGIQGEAGPMGSTGPQGIQGAVGPMGPTGPQGIQGEAGPMGPTGPQGIQGAVGPMGPTGPQGIQGLQGLQGIQGPVGPQGATGAVGPQGAVGPEGPMGPTGPIAGTNMQMVYNDNGSAGGANVFYDNTNTRMGVGVDTPSETLDVNGNLRHRGFICGPNGKKRIDVNVFSAGLGSTGAAHSVYVNGVLVSTSGRAVHMTVLSGVDGSVIHSQTYDTCCGDPSGQGNVLAAAIPTFDTAGNIIILNTWDEPQPISTNLANVLMNTMKSTRIVQEGRAYRCAWAIAYQNGLGKLGEDISNTMGGGIQYGNNAQAVAAINFSTYIGL